MHVNGEKARHVITAIPLTLVNTIAVVGQVSFLVDHLSWFRSNHSLHIAGCIVFAMALESIALFLASQSHMAMVANDSSLRLRLASYAFGCGIGAMNYSHFATWNHPNFEAVAVGLMSSSSPFLWAIHSRRMSRDILMSLGIIESRAVRLGITRVFWHPIKSVRVISFASWHGENRVSEAIAQWEESCDDNEPFPPNGDKRFTLNGFKNWGDVVTRKPSVSLPVSPSTNGYNNAVAGSITDDANDIVSDSGRNDIVSDSGRNVDTYQDTNRDDTEVPLSTENGDLTALLKMAESKSEAVRIVDSYRVTHELPRYTARQMSEYLATNGMTVSDVLVRNVRSKDEKRNAENARRVIRIAESESDA